MDIKFILTNGVKNGVPLVFGFQLIKFESYCAIFFRSLKNVYVKLTRRRLGILQYWDLFDINTNFICRRAVLLKNYCSKFCHFELIKQIINAF